ncbi:MAG TPA: stage II sporulation protein M [Solirubrobacteraceae bacterium]|nr:stage II sporulation protein M [Solirubrobacteraceae bacterium]
MDASAYAFVQGVRSTRSTLARWNRRPWPVLRSWLLGSAIAAAGLLAAVWAVSALMYGPGLTGLHRPPLVVGGMRDVSRILIHNSLVLALHAMACVAGFIAGSSLPLQAQGRTGLSRAVHEHGGRIAIMFVAAATIFSLSVQSYVLGASVAHVAFALHIAPGILLAGLLPHALAELTALFLPLAAWIIASRRGDWDQLLAATLVTVLIAVPMLVLTALWEVYVAPHVLHGLIACS